MHPALFYFFATLMLVFGVMVVALRNPVSNALSLVVSLVSMAALFISLHAFFIGIIQILVYAGAVMVLFLFIIMLLDLRGDTGTRKTGAFGILAGVGLGAAFSFQLVGVLSGFTPGLATLEDTPIDFAQAVALRGDDALSASATATLSRSVLPDVQLLGETLFTHYNLHLQIVGVLLLVATVGVVVLSKRGLR